MQQCQKSTNSKGTLSLSAQHSVSLPIVFLEQRLYKMLPCLTETQWVAWTLLKRSTLDPGSHRTVLVKSSGRATKPTLSRVAASCWALCWHINPNSCNQATKLTLLCCFGVRDIYTSHSHSSHCNVYVHLGVSPAQGQWVAFIPSIPLCGKSPLSMRVTVTSHPL